MHRSPSAGACMHVCVRVRQHPVPVKIFAELSVDSDAEGIGTDNCTSVAPTDDRLTITVIVLLSTRLLLLPSMDPSVHVCMYGKYPWRQCQAHLGLVIEDQETKLGLRREHHIFRRVLTSSTKASKVPHW